MTAPYTLMEDSSCRYTIRYEDKPLLTLQPALPKEPLLRLLDQCNEEVLDPLHLPEVIEDFLWVWEHGRH